MRELIFANNGTVAPGDENAPDIGELGYKNLSVEVEEPSRQHDLSRLRSYDTFTARLPLSPEEWEEIPSPKLIWDEETALAQTDESDEDSDEIEDDVQAGPAISSCYWENVGEACVVLENTALVRRYGFPVDALLTPQGNPMGVEYLAVVTTACKAADQLADLAGNGEVLKVIGWKGHLPTKLSGFGVDRLFRNAGALQARAAEIVEARKPKVAPKAIQAVKPAIALPARQSAARQASAPVTLVVPTQKPKGSDPFGRVSTLQGLAFKCVCGCGAMVLESVAMVPPVGAMRDRQNGARVGSRDLWRHAFGPSCIRRFGRGFSLKETSRQMQDEESKREAANRRAVRPHFGDVIGNGGASGSSGKGASAAQLAHKAKRGEEDRQLRLKMQSAGKK